MEPTVLAAQRAAIEAARERYARGEIPFEAFQRALDALLLARSHDEVHAILRALPESRTALVTALDDADLPAAMTPGAPRHKWIVAFMGQTKKVRRSWRLAPATYTLALMGEVKLDLNLAELPARSKIRVAAVMGAVTLRVPRNVRVSVRSIVLLGDTHALGEGTSGVIANGHEEHVPSTVPAAAQVEIEAFALMGSVKVELTDGPVVTIRELVGDAVRVAADGVRRGLQQGASQRPSLGPGTER